MTTRCNAERIFQPLHDLLEKLSDSELKANKDKNGLVTLLPSQ